MKICVLTTSVTILLDSGMSYAAYGRALNKNQPVRNVKKIDKAAENPTINIVGPSGRQRANDKTERDVSQVNRTIHRARKTNAPATE